MGFFKSYFIAIFVISENKLCLYFLFYHHLMYINLKIVTWEGMHKLYTFQGGFGERNSSSVNQEGVLPLEKRKLVQFLICM